MVKMYINLKHGKWVGICGELGADTTLTERFVRMGIDELSVSPSMVLGVRRKQGGKEWKASRYVRKHAHLPAFYTRMLTFPTPGC